MKLWKNKAGNFQIKVEDIECYRGEEDEGYAKLTFDFFVEDASFDHEFGLEERLSIILETISGVAEMEDGTVINFKDFDAQHVIRIEDIELSSAEELAKNQLLNFLACEHDVQFNDF